MFDLCFRGSRGTLNYYILYQRVKIDTNFEYKIRRLYPPDASEIYTTRILEFGFACCNEKRVGEEFVIVFTDQTGSLEYVFCLCPNESYILCISSALPWCSCFRALLDIIWRNELYQDARWSTLETMLTRLMHTAPPPLSVSYVTCPDPFNIDRDLKFRIPTPRFPHTLKYVMEYYNSLDTSLWIHVFVCLLLERSVLFFSDRLTRLTSCILAAVSLLYPLQWVHSFYPIIPKKVIQVLECPVPFVAGIHACSLPEALDHLSSGTCLVDLDKGQMTIFRGPDNLHSVRLEDFSTPKAVYHFLSHQLKDVQNQLGDAMQSKKSKYANWKRVDGETCAFLDQLTRPFFRLIVNLLGCYPDCIVENLGIPEVDLDALVACQSCPGLESFMRNLCESQTVRLFLDNRARQIPDPSTDLFEVVSATLRADAKPQRTCKSAGADTTRYRTPAIPIAFAVNGSSHTVSSHRPNASRIKSSPPYRPINFGSVLWLRSKKMKRPGEPYSWESLSSNMRHISGSKSSLTSHSWTQKLRAQASTLRNLSRSREYLSPENRSPASLHSEPLRASIRNRSRARTLAPPSSSMRLNPSNMQSKLTPSDSADLNISCVNTTLPSASAPLCPSAFEIRASTFIDSSTVSGKWVTESHRKNSPPTTSEYTYTRTVSVPDSVPAFRKQPPPPRPPPPRIPAIPANPNTESIDLLFEEQPASSQVFTSSDPETTRPIFNGVPDEAKRGQCSRGNSMSVSPSVHSRSKALPPRPKPWSPLMTFMAALKKRITRANDSFDQHQPANSPDCLRVTTRVRSQPFATVGATRTCSRPRNTQYAQTTGRMDGLRQIKLHSELTNSPSPPPPPPRPHRRPLSQLFPSEQTEQLNFSPPSRLIARRQAAHSSLIAAQSEVRHRDSISNPQNPQSTGTEKDDNRCSSVPPLPPRTRELRSHTFSVPSEPSRIKSLPLHSRTAPNLSTCVTPLWLRRRSSSVQNLATGDSEHVPDHPAESSSESASPILYMGRQIQLRKKYATFSQRHASVEAAPTYKLHRARTVSCKSWRNLPPMPSLMQQTSQLSSGASAPIAIAESHSGGEFSNLAQSPE